MPNGHPEGAYQPPEPMTRKDMREIVREELLNFRNVAGNPSHTPHLPMIELQGDGRWQWIVGAAGFDSYEEARKDWALFVGRMQQGG